MPFSALKVQKKRPYFFGRNYTETDVGYLAFFGAMHAIALVGGPLTYTPEALQARALRKRVEWQRITHASSVASQCDVCAASKSAQCRMPRP